MSFIDFIIKYFLFAFLIQSREMLTGLKIKYGKFLRLCAVGSLSPGRVCGSLEQYRSCTGRQ